MGEERKQCRMSSAPSLLIVLKLRPSILYPEVLEQDFDYNFGLGLTLRVMGNVPGIWAFTHLCPSAECDLAPTSPNLFMSLPCRAGEVGDKSHPIGYNA
jgi:hypothetical protein